MSLRVVIDTNIRFSAFVYRGTPALLVILLQAAGFLEVVSQPLLDEYEDILKRKSGRTPEAIATEMASLVGRVLIVKPNKPVFLCRDPDDNRIIECALAGQAGYIISGDRDLLVLGSVHGIPILTVRQFLDRLSQQDIPLK